MRFSKALSKPLDEKHRLATLALTASRLYVPGAGISPGKRVRVHIPARDVMLATARPEGLSALNIIDGTIREISPADDGTVDVEIDCGGDIIHSRITALSAERLDLVSGKPVFAVIKSVALQP